MATPKPRMHLRYAQPHVLFYFLRAMHGQERFPGVPRTKSSILLTIRIRQIQWRVIGLPTTLDVFLIGKDSLDSHTTSVLQACAINYVLILS
jgi:hypothetical protein